MIDALPILQWQHATIVEIIPQTTRIKSFILDLSNPFIYRAGQHVNLRLTAPDGYQTMRSYSIASAPDERSRIELAIERLDGGEVSRFFHDVAAVGDELELRGPLGGHFTWTAADGGPLLLTGGGSGVVPLMAMIRDRQTTLRDTPAALIYSARCWSDLLYREELFDFERKPGGVEVLLTLTRDTPRRKGDYARRVDAAIIQEALTRLRSAPKHVFICGSNAFVNAAADGMVAAGVSAAIIRTERYGT